MLTNVPCVMPGFFWRGDPSVPQGHSLLRTECSLNEDECSLNDDECSLNDDECSLNVDKCSLNMDDCSQVSSGEAIRVYHGHHKATVCCALNDSAIEGHDVDSP